MPRGETERCSSVRGRKQTELDAASNGPRRWPWADAVLSGDVGARGRRNDKETACEVQFGTGEDAIPVRLLSTGTAICFHAVPNHGGSGIFCRDVLR